MTRLILAPLYSARYTWMTSMLVLVLQRTPVLRVFLQVDPGIDFRAGQLLRAALPLAAAAGAVNTLTGATTFTTNPASPASGDVGQEFALVFAVTGTESLPKSYSIDGALPAGLTVPNAVVTGTQRKLNAATGSISGTPTESGSFTVGIVAYEKSNLSGKSSKTFNVTIDIAGAAAVAPTFTTQPASQSVTAGDPVTFTIAVSGSPAPTLQWRKDGVALGGETSTSLAFSNVAEADAGAYDCVATNSAGTVTSAAATLAVSAAAVAPSFTTQPASQSVTVGDSVTFTVAVSGNPAPSLQWRKDGAALGGETTTTLSLANVAETDAGDYDCVATNSAGTTSSNAGTLTVSPAAVAAPPEISLHPGSMTGLAGSAASFQVQATGTGLTYQWLKDGSPINGATSSTLYLSGLTSDDAGGYSVIVANSDSGQVESNVATLTVAQTGSARLLNVSTRAGVGVGANNLIPGFVVSGNVALPVLIRAVGPALADFGVSGALADPMMTVYSGSDAIATNDNWEENANLTELSAAATAVGAFPLTAGSKDAAVLVVLKPGAYTVVVNGKDGAMGESLVEVYEANP